MTRATYVVITIYVSRYLLCVRFTTLITFTNQLAS
jgi:hypothetical protein